MLQFSNTTGIIQFLTQERR